MRFVAILFLLSVSAALPIALVEQIAQGNILWVVCLFGGLVGVFVRGFGWCVCFGDVGFGQDLKMDINLGRFRGAYLRRCCF